MKAGKVLVAISGGVDSAAACLQLIRTGWTVEAAHFLIPGISREQGQSSQYGAETDIQKLERLTSELGVPLHIIDKQDVFRKKVIAYFVNSYATGQTPNPCVLCNPDFKLAIAIEFADRLGIEFIATGHYARVVCDGGVYSLLKAFDTAKDQSYFLHRIPKSWLARLLLPIGGITKDNAREIVSQAGLAHLMHGESQDICFLSGDYRQFLEAHGVRSFKGSIVTTDGRQVGEHNGLFGYTIGQRHGLGIPDRTPFYVIGLDVARNQLVVGKKEELFKQGCLVDRVNWLEPFENWRQKVSVKLRYRHPGVLCQVKLLTDDSLFVSFDMPQSAITPGQFAVFYDEEKVLGGGSICG